MEKTSLKMILHALPQDDMMELEQMIDKEKMKRNDQRYLSQHLGKISITKDGRWTTNCHTGHGTGRKQKKITCRTREEFDMLPPSRTLKYKTCLGVFLCLEKVRSIQH